MAGLRTRRRADEFHALLEGSGSDEAGAERFAADLELARELRAVPSVEPRAEFSQSLRAELMAEAAHVLTPTAAKLTVRPQRTGRERRIAVAIGGFAVVSASVSMGAAAQSALPGETLYPLKRLIENVDTQLRFDETQRAAVLLDQASGRLTEVRALIHDEGGHDAPIASALHAFSHDARSGAELILDHYQRTGEEAPVQQLNDFTTTSSVDLGELRSAVPESARPALIEATQVVEQIEQQVRYACAGCGADVAPVAAVTRELLSGPAYAVPDAEPASAPQRRQREAAPQPEAEAPVTPEAPPQREASDPPETETPTKGLNSTVKKTTDSINDLTKSVTGQGDTTLIDGLSDTLTRLGETTSGLLNLE